MQAGEDELTSVALMIDIVDSCFGYVIGAWRIKKIFLQDSCERLETKELPIFTGINSYEFLPLKFCDMCI